MVINKIKKTVDFKLKQTTGMDSPHPNTPIHMYNMAIKCQYKICQISNKSLGIGKGRGP